MHRHWDVHRWTCIEKLKFASTGNFVPEQVSISLPLSSTTGDQFFVEPRRTMRTILWWSLALTASGLEVNDGLPDPLWGRKRRGSPKFVSMSSSHPAGGDPVEIGVDRIWADFGSFGMSGTVKACSDAPAIAMCASTTVEKPKSNTKMRCWNASAIAVTVERGILRASVDLSNDKITDFDALTTVIIEEGVLCGTTTIQEMDLGKFDHVDPSKWSLSKDDDKQNRTTTLQLKNAFGTWMFRTVSAPEVPVDANTANTTVATKTYSVYGIGVFMNDVATIDVGAGTFYGDVSIYALRYYRTFVDAKTALDEATIDDGVHGRECAQSVDTAEKWLLLKKFDPEVQMKDDEVAVTDEGRFVTLVNAGKFPKVEVEYRADTDFDHVRVRTEFYFEPTLRSYPFQRQTLPVTIELASDVLRQTPSKLLCLLAPYSGFAPKLSSFSAQENQANVLTASAVVDEAPRAPPFPACGHAQFVFPREDSPRLRGTKFEAASDEPPAAADDPSGIASSSSEQLSSEKSSSSSEATTTTTTTAAEKKTETQQEEEEPFSSYPCAAKRSTSRLSLNIVYEPPLRLGAMVLLPSGLIGAGALVSYALADPVSRLQTLATSLLAAVVQHASIRAALPPRSVVTTADEFAFSIYAIVAVALAASFFVALCPSADSRKLAGAAGIASIIFFGHPKRPAGLDLDWATAIILFVSLFFVIVAVVMPRLLVVLATVLVVDPLSCLLSIISCRRWRFCCHHPKGASVGDTFGCGGDDDDDDDSDDLLLKNTTGGDDDDDDDDLDDERRYLHRRRRRGLPPNDIDPTCPCASHRRSSKRQRKRNDHPSDL